MRTNFTSPRRAVTGAVTGALLLTTMGFGSQAAMAANGDPAPTTGTAANGVDSLSKSVRSGSLAVKSPTMLAKAREMLLRNKLVKIARAQIGDRYVAGRTGPNAFDCSGLTSYVYKVAAGEVIPRSSFTQYRAAKRISRKSLMPGDLVFFFKRGVHHVAVYVGAEKIVHAARPREGVKITPMSDPWVAAHISGYGRFVPSTAS
ncbi:MAG: C40 family peptidase [Candidatus Nanopelagicales bacterium]|nr:C40 family peptidase [Candidatus Nanopelagicales bacterium]